jgi:hypothetical protein
VGVLHDQFPDELREGGENVETQAAAGGGGVQRLVQGSEADPAPAEYRDVGSRLAVSSQIRRLSMPKSRH